MQKWLQNTIPTLNKHSDPMKDILKIKKGDRCHYPVLAAVLGFDAVLSLSKHTLQ